MTRQTIINEYFKNRFSGNNITIEELVKSKKMSKKELIDFCKKEEILINEDLKNIEPRCAYCNSKKVIEEGQYDNLKECLRNKEY